MRTGFKAAAIGLAMLSGFAAARADAPTEPLTADTSTGAHRFKVEVMRTEPDREHGLMFRKSMARDHGMLFEYPAEQPLAFWMHNTFLPLDLIFIGADGRVVSIAANAKPMDDTLIPSRAPALGVLEVDAGVAKAIDLKVGDRIRHPMFHDSATR